MALFRDPHAFVSPTWNDVAVHACGRAEVNEDIAGGSGCWPILQRSTFLRPKRSDSAPLTGYAVTNDVFGLNFGAA
jgi:predicted FMN-binding regulatory protein PaiB